MRNLVRSQSKKRGLPPGTPVFVGDKLAEAVQITVIDYDEAEVIEKQLKSVDECKPFKGKPTVTWINVDGLHDAKLVESLAEGFGLHPLVQEDILNTTQRPKFDDYGDYLYAVLKMLQWDGERDEAVTEQISLILGMNFVISFQEKPGDVFGPIRERIRGGKGRIRKMPADYLAYCLIDAIVDGYFVVLEHLGDEIEAVESALVISPTPETLGGIHRLKRESLLLRKSVWPLREVISGLERTESQLVTDATHLYLRDAYGHSVQVIDTMETFRDMLAGTLDTYLSSLSNRMNEVMKVLTIIATIFIPLTFIAGIYGMNFKHMPELEWRWGYGVVLGAMAIASGGMLLYFRRKRWL
jgi:magnesium transporter